MRFADLGLKMGDVMQLQVSADSEARYPIKLLGFIPDCSVIISAPVMGKGKFIFVKDEQMVTLRFVVNSVASGFSARVLASRTTPRPYIHLEMPKQVQAVEVRNSARVDAELNMTFMNESQKAPLSHALLTNVSAAGGRFESEQKTAAIGDRISMTMTLAIDEVQKLISYEGVVRNMGKLAPGEAKSGSSSPSYWYGFNFEFSDEEEKIMLKAYVYQEILRSLHML